MGTISRPIKAAGNATYFQEVEDGKLDIIDQELDDDFDKLYKLVNGNIDGDNINPGTGTKISYDRLNLTGRVVDADIVNLNASKLFGTIGSGVALPPGSVDTAELALGASCFIPPQTHHNETARGITGSPTVFETTTITSRNGPVLISATAHCQLVVPVPAGGQATFTARLRISGAGIVTPTDLRVVSLVATAGGSLPALGTNSPITLVLDSWGSLFGAGSRTLELLLDVQSNLGGAGGNCVSSSLSFVELG